MKQRATVNTNHVTSKETIKHVISNDIIEDILETIANSNHSPSISEPENNTSIRSLDDPCISDDLGNDLN